MREKRRFPLGTISTSFYEKIGTGGLITLSQLRRSVLYCKIGRKRLSSVKKRARLAHGYRVMAALNAKMAEESVSSDNEALAAGEQKLTECETK